MNGKQNLYVLATMLFVALLAMPAVSAADAENPDGEEAVADDNINTVEAAKWSAKGYIAIGAGLAVGLAGIGTGLAQSNIGSAAVGAVAEDDKNFTNGLIFVAIPETVVIFGLVISALLIFVMGA
jgi:V/A-type H+-transporting ATPase subunit K|tara:strand:+ start:66 stop:440 length:375 start_codon:yes stop_codon:yes gene_type:complete